MILRDKAPIPRVYRAWAMWLVPYGVAVGAAGRLNLATLLNKGVAHDAHRRV